jgi:hypothetical protein
MKTRWSFYATMSLWFTCPWLGVVNTLHSFEALVFLLIRTIGNLDQFSTGINQKLTKSPESYDSYEYGKLSVTTIKFANFVSHRLNNNGQFLKWLFISWGSREPEAFKFLALAASHTKLETWVYLDIYESLWLMVQRHMYQLDHIASAESSGT